MDDVTAPTCQLISLQADCGADCGSSRWTVSARVTDEAGGTGVANVTLKAGNGTLRVTHGDVTLASYNASCCAPTAELRVEDGAGNVASCLYSLCSSAAASLRLCLLAAALALLVQR